MPCKIDLFVFFCKAGLGNEENHEQNGDQEEVPSSPVDVIRSGVIFVQKWAPLLKDSDQEMIAETQAGSKIFECLQAE